MLPFAEEAFDVIVSTSTLDHFAHRRDIVSSLHELHRVLRPGGEVLLAFHVGDEVRHVDKLWEQQVSLDFIFYQRTWVEEHLRAAGFEIVESMEREPYEDFEAATRRAYIRAHKPDQPS